MTRNLPSFALSIALAACSADGAAGVQCGDELTCGSNELCVESQGWGTEFRCVENPCGTSQPTCDCAASVCEESAGSTCSSVADQQVTCVCPTC